MFSSKVKKSKKVQYISSPLPYDFCLDIKWFFSFSKCSAEYICSRLHVHILFAGSFRTKLQKVFVVEKIPNSTTTGKQFLFVLFTNLIRFKIIQVQFFLVMIHIFVGVSNNCKAPKWLAFMTVGYLCTLVALFLNFYVKSYKQQSASGFYKIKAKSSDSEVDIVGGGDWKCD